MPTERHGSMIEAELGDKYGDGVGGMGSADHAKIESAFSASPVISGDIPLWQDYLDNVLRGNSDITSTTLDMTVRDASGTATLTPSRTFEENNPPNISAPSGVSSITIGGGGLPGSPWTPNLASPGETDGISNGVDYTKIPDDEITLSNEDAQNNPGVGQGGTYSPSSAAEDQTTTDPVDGTGNSSYTLGSYSAVSVAADPVEEA